MPEIAAAVCEVVYANFCLGWQGIVLRTACRVVVRGALRAENETADQVLSRQGYRNNNLGAEDIAVMVMRRNSLRGSQRMDEIPIQRVATRSSSCPARVNECEPAREKRADHLDADGNDRLGKLPPTSRTCTRLPLSFFLHIVCPETPASCIGRGFVYLLLIVHASPRLPTRTHRHVIHGPPLSLGRSFDAAP